MDRPTDNDLVAAFRAGDPDAFAEIYDRYSAEIFSRFLVDGRSREEAAEATHDSFLEGARRLGAPGAPDDLRSSLLASAGSIGGDLDVEVPPPNELTSAPVALRPRVLKKVENRSAVVPGPKAPMPEWMKMGVFAAVTLVVGLLGFAVSAQFEPHDPLPTVPGAETPAAGQASTTTTSTPSSSSTTLAPEGSTTSPSSSSTAAPTPAAIEVSTDSVDFGSDGTVNEIELTNTGGQPGNWEIASSSEAISVSAGQGEISGGESVTIELSLDRGNVEEGELAETLTITWSGGEHEVAVVGSLEDNPIIHNPQASPSSVEVSGNEECTNTQSTVSARIRDTSPLESVVMRWSPDGGTQQETEMTSIGNDMFEGVVGPFTTAQSADVRIVAFDELGNAGGATAVVTVVACP